MVELVVCFGLLMLFIGAAASVMSSYMRVTNQVSSSAEAQTVCDSLLNKVQDFLASADSVSVSGTSIECTKIGVVYELGLVDLAEGSDKKVLAYYPKGNTEPDKITRFVGDSSYMGNYVETFGFEKVDGSGKSVIKVTIKLKSLRGIEYEDYKMFRVKKIV